MKIQSVYLFPIILFLICRFIQNQINIVNTNITILVKLVSVMLILFYGFIDIKYGFICCLGIIIYFNFHNKLSEGFEYDSIPSIKDNENEIIQNELTNSYTDLSISHGSNEIPKIIIQIWKTWTNKNPNVYREYINSIKSFNPTYEYIFFKDEDIDIFLKNNYPKYYNTYNKLPLNIQKVDFFRYVAIYHYGGFYFDLDMNGLQSLDNLLQYECVFPIDEIINKNICKTNTRFNSFCNSNQMFLLGQYGFAAKPKNEFIELLINNIHNNILKIINTYNNILTNDYENYVYITTGPDYVTNEYIKYTNKSSIKILNINKRQYFGRYAKHLYVGSWK